MTIRVVCPHCRATNEVPDDLLGRKIRCHRCDEIMVAARSDAVSERPRRAARRGDADDDDDRPAARRGARRRRSKGGLGPVAIFVTTFALLLIVVAGLVGAYFLTRDSQPTQAQQPAHEQNPPVPPFGGAEAFLIDRQPQLEAFFRAPEEPPTRALTFAEPPAAGDAGPGNGGPQPVRNNGPLTPEVLQKIKESAVFIAVQSQRGQGSGSGFFAGEPGFVITNAHVVFMLQRGAPPPSSIKVVRNKGEQNEVTLAAQVVAVDPDADLAVLSVPKQGLPPPLVVKSALSLHETQPVYVAGFPLGERPGKNVTINEYKVSSLKKEKGVLDKVQIHGEMVFGNSGGPVLDADGNVVGVCVAILPDPRVDTHINFAVPGDKVLRLLNGRFADLTVEAPARADDGGLRVPVAVRVTDPLGRLRQAGVDFWVGAPGPSRPGGRTPPKPLPDDGPRKTVTLTLQQQAGRGELALPHLPEGRAYWVQPSLAVPGGGRVWMSAHVYQPPPPVERKPARLAWEPAGDRPLVLERWSSLHFNDPGGGDHQALLTVEARLTESVRGRQGSDMALYRQFTGFKEGVSYDDQVHMSTRLQQVAPHIQYVADSVLADAQGTTKRAEYDLAKLKDAPPMAKSRLSSFQQETAKFLQALEVPLPGREVQPGETWKARRPMAFEAGWRQLDPFAAQLWGSVENEWLEIAYTYAGVRSVNGTERAVINLKGQAVPQPGVESGSTAGLSGMAVLDLATGQVVEEEVTTQAHAELLLFNTAAIKAQGVLVARLRQE